MSSKISPTNARVVDALRLVLKEKRFWRTHSQFADDLKSFEDRLGLRCGFDGEVVRNIVSRKRGANDLRISAIIDFLETRDIRYNHEIGAFSYDPIIEKPLRREYSGVYRLLYDLGKSDPVTKQGFLNSRIYNIKNNAFHKRGIEGSLLSFGIENSFENTEISTGSLDIFPGISDSDAMLFVEENPNRLLPPVSFKLRYVSIKGEGAFYGVGIGFQSEDISTIAATRVIAIPIRYFSHLGDSKATIEWGDVPETALRLMREYLHGENYYDSSSTLNSGTNFMVGESRIDVSNFFPTLFAELSQENG